MTHDVLCPTKVGEQLAAEDCWRCRLIEKVRADERAKDLDFAYVAADAEAHEKAAVDDVICDFLSNHGDKHIREQTIRDCIAAVENLAWGNDNWHAHHERAHILTALRALLEGDKP